MDFFGLNMGNFSLFLLLLIRCAVILYVLPFFGSNTWPALAKAGLAMLMAFLLFPRAASQDWPRPQTAFDFGLLVITEFMIALCLGLTFHLILAGIQTGGQLVGFQLGFGIVNVIDPQSGSQVSIMAQVAYLVGVLLFLCLDGHHWFIKAMAESVTVLKPGRVALTSGLFRQTMALTGELFVIALKVMAPAVAALLFSKTAMGIVAKAVPQINVFLVSFPVTIGVGLFFFGLCLSLMGHFFEGFVGRDLGLLLSRDLREMGGR